MGIEQFVRGRLIVRVGAAVLPAVLGALLGLVRAGFSQAAAVLVFVLAIVAVAGFGDRIAGVVAALSSGVWFDFFFVEPFHSLSITNRDDVELVVLLLIIGLSVTEIALWGRRQASAASVREGYIDGVLAVAGDDEAGPDGAEAIAARITDVLGVDRTRYVEGPPAHDNAVVDHAGTVIVDGRPVKVESAGLPTERFLAIPVQRGGQVVGHFQVVAATSVVRPSADAVKVAVLLAEQMAAPVARAGR